jgi:SAM-dependent methyltransferase
MDWRYDSWPSGEPYNWGGASRGTSSWDQLDFHVDLGCGAGVKKGRIGIDQFPAPGVNVVMDLDKLEVYGCAPAPGRDAGSIDMDGWRLLGPTGIERHYPRSPRGPNGEQIYTLMCGLPFEDNSIKSIVSHHCLEHIGAGFIPLVEEIYRVLEPGGIFRAITPLFPSRAAVDDPTHVRYFTETTWLFCTGKPGETHWMESFSVPYTTARFEIVDQDVTRLFDPHQRWQDVDAREIRVALKAHK